MEQGRIGEDTCKIRSTKSETINKILNDKCSKRSVSEFEHCDLDIVSDFDIRI